MYLCLIQFRMSQFFSPTYFDGLKCALNSAIYVCNNVAAVRYPRGGELYKPDDFGEESITYDIYGNKDCGKLIITYGRLFSYACKAKRNACGKRHRSLYFKTL